MDEGSFTVEASKFDRSKSIRGRGAVGKSNVAIMAESTPLINIETIEISNKLRYLKAKALRNQKME